MDVQVDTQISDDHQKKSDNAVFLIPILLVLILVIIIGVWLIMSCQGPAQWNDNSFIILLLIIILFSGAGRCGCKC
jgi:membrane protein YdbS with pleckstrin-like domain